MFFVERLRNRFKKIEAENKKIKAEIKELNEKHKALLGINDELALDMMYKYHELLPEEKYKEEIKKRMLQRVGIVMDFEAPKTLNEKIQWLKFNDNIPEKATLTDKLAVRDWVREKLGEEYLKKIYGPWDNFDEIDMESLPEPFILKPNHGSAMTMIVKNKNEMDKDDARQKVNKWLTTNYAYRGLEMQYKDINPLVFAEEYYGDKGKDFFEYKIHCFNGKVGFLSTATRENDIATGVTIYYPNWELTPFKTKEYPIKPTEKPAVLPELIRTAEILSRDFKLVRVDLFVMKDNSIKFGEMTFTPTNGQGHWDPPEYDRKLGNLLRL